MPTSLPKRIVLTGFMGAGKSTVGVRLARQLEWEFVDLDEEIVRAEQKAIAAIFDQAGEASFRALEHLALARALARTRIVLALGGGALETASNRELLTADRDALLFYLEAPLEVLLSRCDEQHHADPRAPRRPVLESRAALTQRFLRRKPFYESASRIIQTAQREPDEIARDIAAHAGQWQNSAAAEASQTCP